MGRLRRESAAGLDAGIFFATMWKQAAPGKAEVPALGKSKLLREDPELWRFIRVTQMMFAAIWGTKALEEIDG